MLKKSNDAECLDEIESFTQKVLSKGITFW